MFAVNVCFQVNNRVSKLKLFLSCVTYLMLPTFTDFLVWERIVFGPYYRHIQVNDDLNYNEEKYCINLAPSCNDITCH